MATPDYIPRNDSAFNDWFLNFVTVLEPKASGLGLLSGEMSALTAKQADVDGAITEQLTKQAAASAAVEQKKTVRTSAEQLVRPIVRRITAHPTMTNEVRALLGITVLSGGHTPSSAGIDVPGLYLETKPGQVIVHFGTDASNELHNGKPAWARGCNVYRKKPGESDFTMIAFDSASPYADTVSGTAIDCKYKVAYRATRENDLGPMSPEQTIAAGG